MKLFWPNAVILPLTPLRILLPSHSSALHHADRDILKSALEALPAEFREALVLRELEGLSYKEIADIADVPIGTVMSRLARARKQLQEHLGPKGDVRI